MGARRVLVLPYFLNEGLHIKLDIPLMMQTAAQKHEGIRLVFGKNLGFDPLIVRLVEKRIEESEYLNDVRELRLPHEDAYRFLMDNVSLWQCRRIWQRAGGRRRARLPDNGEQ